MHIQQKYVFLWLWWLGAAQHFSLSQLTLPSCASADATSCCTVSQFGKFNRVAFPGFNCVWCCVGESIAGGLSLRIQQLDVRCETKTKVRPSELLFFARNQIIATGLQASANSHEGAEA